MTPSPGAMRAARAILTGPIWPVSDETLARIIDRETHAAELVAALKALEGTVSQFVSDGYLVEPETNEKARALLARIEGRTILPADPTAFAGVEKPNVSPTEDR